MHTVIDENLIQGPPSIEQSPFRYQYLLKDGRRLSITAQTKTERHTPNQIRVEGNGSVVEINLGHNDDLRDPRIEVQTVGVQRGEEHFIADGLKKDDSPKTGVAAFIASDRESHNKRMLHGLTKLVHRSGLNFGTNEECTFVEKKEGETFSDQNNHRWRLALQEFKQGQPFLEYAKGHSWTHPEKECVEQKFLLGTRFLVPAFIDEAHRHEQGKDIASIMFGVTGQGFTHLNANEYGIPLIDGGGLELTRIQSGKRSYKYSYVPKFGSPEPAVEAGDDTKILFEGIHSGRIEFLGAIVPKNTRSLVELRYHIRDLTPEEEKALPSKLEVRRHGLRSNPNIAEDIISELHGEFNGPKDAMIIVKVHRSRAHAMLGKALFPDESLHQQYSNVLQAAGIEMPGFIPEERLFVEGRLARDAQMFQIGRSPDIALRQLGSFADRVENLCSAPSEFLEDLKIINERVNASLSALQTMYDFLEPRLCGHSLKP